MAKETEQKKAAQQKTTVAKKTTAVAPSKVPAKSAEKKVSVTKPASSVKAPAPVKASKKDSSIEKTIEAKVASSKKPEKTKKPTKAIKEKKAKKPKKPKGRVRIGPIIVVSALIAGIIVCERFFLDAIVKNAIISVIQSEYGAKCEIERVDLELWDGSFVVENFALADKASPMKNLFEFSRSSIDFDVTQVFLGKFVADELSLEGFMLGTERETSGELPLLLRESAPKDDSKEGKFALAINDKTSEIAANGKNIIEQAAETYNPENMMASYLEKLQVPELVESSQKEVAEITSYWQGAAPELEESGVELFESIEEVRALLDTQDVDIATIRKGVDSIQSLLSEGKELQSQVDAITSRLDKDIDTVSTLNTTIQNAIVADKNVIQSEIENITSFTFSDAQGLLGSTIEGFFIGALGDYYPTVQKVLTLLSNAKAEAQESKIEAEKKAHERLRGRTVHFNATMPTFLIRNTVFSGSDSAGGLAVSGFAYDISNNPDLLQKPATANLDLIMQDFSGTLDAVVDLRSETENYPVEAVLYGSGLDTSVITQSGTLGVPSIGGDADINAEAKFELAGDFDLSANFDFNPALLSVSEFEPNTVYTMYSNILKEIYSFYVQTDIVYSYDDGMDINLDTDVDKKIADGLSSALNAEIEALKDSLRSEAEDYLTSYTDAFMENVEDFGLSRDSILDLQNGLGNIDGELENIKAELEQRIKDEATGAVQEKAQDAASGLLKGLF